MTFRKNSGERGYHTHINNAAFVAYNSYLTGLGVASTSGMQITFNLGTLLYQGLTKSVISSSVTLTNGDASYPRIDLVVYNGTIITKIDGTAAAIPKPADYDPSIYTVLYQVYVSVNQTVLIGTEIEDIKMIFVGAPQDHNSTTGKQGGTSSEYYHLTSAQHTNLTGASTSFTAVSVTGLTATRLMATNVSSGLSSVATLSSWIAGTNLSVTDDGDGTITLAIPQSVATTATPTFVSVTDQQNIFAAIATPANPSAGYLKIYAKSDDKMYKLNSAGVEQEIGTGSGGGVKSYAAAFTLQTTLVVNHAMNTTNVIVQVYDSADEMIIPQTIDITDANNITITFATATTGKVFILTAEAAAPALGGVGTYLHTQSSAATWTVTHNLNDSYPQVQVFDNTGNVIEPQTIVVTTNNVLTLTFAVATAGYARVLAGQFTGGTGDGNFLPTVDNTYDLGSSSYKWKDLYLSGSSINLGGLVITNNAGVLNAGGAPVGSDGDLGEVRQYAITESGAITAATLQARKWAICNGTTPASQGISSPTVFAAGTPNFTDKFIRGAATSGVTGGADTHTLTVDEMPAHTHTIPAGGLANGSNASRSTNTEVNVTSSSAGGGLAHNNVPSYYSLVFFVKVKL